MGLYLASCSFRECFPGSWSTGLDPAFHTPTCPGKSSQWPQSDRAAAECWWRSRPLGSSTFFNWRPHPKPSKQHSDTSTISWLMVISSDLSISHHISSIFGQLPHSIVTEKTANKHVLNQTNQTYGHGPKFDAKTVWFVGIIMDHQTTTLWQIRSGTSGTSGTKFKSLPQLSPPNSVVEISEIYHIVPYIYICVYIYI